MTQPRATHSGTSPAALLLLLVQISPVTTTHQLHQPAGLNSKQRCSHHNDNLHTEQQQAHCVPHCLTTLHLSFSLPLATSSPYNPVNPAQQIACLPPANLAQCCSHAHRPSNHSAGCTAAYRGPQHLPPLPPLVLGPATAASECWLSPRPPASHQHPVSPAEHCLASNARQVAHNLPH